MMLVLFILSSADQKKKKKQHSITFQPYREHICPYKYFGDRPLGKPSSPFDDHKRHGHDIFDRNLKEKFGPVHRQFVRFPGRISFRLFFSFFGSHRVRNVRTLSNALSAIVMESMKPQKWRGRKTPASAQVKRPKKEIKSEEKRSNKQKLTRERKKAQWSGKRTDVTMDPPHSILQRCFCCLAILFTPSSESSQRAIVIHCSRQRRFVMLCNRRRCISAQGWQVFKRWATHFIIKLFRPDAFPRLRKVRNDTQGRLKKLGRLNGVHSSNGKGKVSPIHRLTNSI